MSALVDRLKRQAESIANTKLAWTEGGSIVAGFDWTNEKLFIIDLRHPDGFVIESSELMIDREWDEGMSPLPPLKKENK